MAATAGGGGHCVAAKADGTVWAWGYNASGQLGDGTTIERHAPVQVSGLSGVAAVACGLANSLAVKSDGTVWAWGNNYYGQLGDGTTTERHAPVQVSGLLGVAAVAGGDQHSLAVKFDGTVWAWGYNYCGQLGDGTTTQRNAPVQVPGLSDVVAVACGSSHSLAVKSDGTVWAWGYNEFGQAGGGTSGSWEEYQLSPVQVSGLSDAVAVAGGDWHSLAVKSDGTVWAWGDNGDGQLGDGTWMMSTTPVQVSGLSGAVAVGSGYYHSLALKSDGTAWAWGYNSSGQLGDGTWTSRGAPVQVSGVSGVAAVAGGRSFNLFLGDIAAAPQVAGTWPADSGSEQGVRRVIVSFDRPVANVSPDDLTLSGGSVISVQGSGKGPYLFTVSGVPSGMITATIGGDITAVDGLPLPSYQWTFTNIASPPPLAQSASATAFTAFPVNVALRATDGIPAAQSARRAELHH